MSVPVTRMVELRHHCHGALMFLFLFLSIRNFLLHSYSSPTGLIIRKRSVTALGRQCTPPVTSRHALTYVKEAVLGT
eukprot:4132324-Amphidinium_carterae.1